MRLRALGMMSAWVGVGSLVAACASSTTDSGAFDSTGSSSSSGSGSGGGIAPTSSSGSSGASSGATSSGGGGSSGGTSSGSGSGGSSGGSGGGSTSSSGSSSGGGGGGNAPVPTLGGCSIFPADNPWNTRIDDPAKYPVHASSATYINSMGASTHLHPDWGDWSTDHYGIPWQTVPGSQLMVPMTFQYADESDPGPYPFPANALVEGGAGSGGDMHVLVIDTGTCTLYETWSSTYQAPGWSCGSGAKFDLKSDALRPDGWTSSDAAGLPVLPGLVKVSEVKAGAIHHALRFTVSKSQQGFIHPATHAAGSSDTSLPPMGLRLRLKASFDLSKYSGPALVILTAMKQYGLIVADNGSDWYVSGDSDDAWASIMDPIVQAFGTVTGGEFEAVETGPILH